MKKLVLLSLMMLFSLSMIGQEKGVVFEKGTFAQALVKAKQENKKVFVDCYTQWCGPCHYMSTKVFPTEECGSYMNPLFVSVKIDMEHGEGPNLQKNFKVQAYPTFIIFNADGTEINRFLGMSPNAKEFKGKIERILKGQKPEVEEKEQVKEPAIPQPKDTIYDEGKGVLFSDGATTSLADIMAKAKLENKRIFIDCYTSWCHACKQMEKTTFRDTRMGNMMNSVFINYKINTEKDVDGKAVAEKYQLKAFPTFLILNPDGTEYNRIVGSAPVIEFSNRIMKALMGEEDDYVKMMRMQDEYYAKAKADRKANLHDVPMSVPATKVFFEKTNDLEKAIKKAGKQHKNIHIFISDGDWMSKYMTDNTFKDDKAANYLNRGFVNLFVDAKSKSGDAIMDKFKLDDNFPTYVILDDNGKLKGYDMGIRKTADILIESFDRIINYKASENDN